MSHIKVAELKSVKDNKTPIKADDVLSIGEDIVKIFPSGDSTTTCRPFSIYIFRFIFLKALMLHFETYRTERLQTSEPNQSP